MLCFLHKVLSDYRGSVTPTDAGNGKREGKSCADTGNVHIRTVFSCNIRLRSGIFTISPFGFSVFLVLWALGTPSIVYADIIPDKSAPQHRQPVILPSANGTPQINIQTPTSAGVSVNQYRRFDVDGKGVILNNSRRPAQTRLGGWIQGNPYLAGGEARIIVNQVNSQNPGLLNGYIEVGGKRAEVVIANPAGIAVNGGGFINASRATLTTGRPQYRAGSLTGFQVQSGSIVLGAKGWDTGESDYTRLLGQGVRIDAPIWGKDIRIVAGDNQVSADGDSHSTLSSRSSPGSAVLTAPVPTASRFAVDTGALGGMYADKITLISTDASGNRHQGQIFASAGSVTIDAEGRVMNSGTVLARTQLTVRSEDVQNRPGGRLLSLDGMELDIAGHLHNSKGEIAANGDIRLHDRGAETLRIDNDAGSIQGGSDVAVQSRLLNNRGTLTAGRHLSVEVKEDLAVERDLQAGSTISIRSQGSLNNTHTVAAADSVKLFAGQDIDNRGTVNSNGLTLLQADKALHNRGTGKIYGHHVALSARTLSNREEADENGQPRAAVIAARERLDIAAADIRNLGSGWDKVVNEKRLDGTSSALIGSEGSLAVGRTLDERYQAVGRADTLTNQGAKIESAGDMRLSAVQIKNLNNNWQVKEKVEVGTPVSVTRFRPTGWSDWWIEGKDGTWHQTSSHAKGEFNFYDGRPAVTENDWDEERYVQRHYEDKLIHSEAAKISAGGDLTVDAGLLLNQNSQILIGGELRFTGLGQAGKVLVNEHKPVLTYVTEKGWGRATYPKKSRKKLKYNWVRRTSYSWSVDRDYISGEKPFANHMETYRDHAALERPLYHTETAAVPTVAQLSGSGLYASAPKSKGYLIETDPAFAGYRKWLGSDYMLDALRADPEHIHKRLGDGYYEQKLVTEQINRLTGYRRLDGYSSDEEQFKALMQSGITAAQQLGLTPGISLSAQQLARLTSDIVWLERQNIGMPDGSIQSVWVPKVYVVPRSGDIGTSGSLISAERIRLDLSQGSLDNSGTLAGRKILNLHARNLYNSGHLQGGRILLQADKQLEFKGGSASADTLFAAQAEDITLSAVSHTSHNTNHNKTVLGRMASVYVGADKQDNGILSIQARRDFNADAADIYNAAAQGSTVLSAQHDLNLRTLGTEHHEAYGALSDRNHRHQHRTSEAGSRIQAKHDIVLHSGNDLNIRQGDIDSQNGKITVSAQNNLSITEGRSTLDMDVSSYSESSGLVSRSKRSDRYQRHHDEAVGSSISGRQVVLAAGKDLLIRGSDAVSDDGTHIQAGENIALTAAEHRYTDQEFHQIKKSGLSVSFGSGMISAGYSRAKSHTDEDRDSVHLAASRIGSIKGNTTLSAGTQISTEAAMLTAGQDLTLQARDIRIGSAYQKEQYKTDSYSKSQGFNLSLNLKAPEIRQIQTGIQGYRSAAKEKTLLQKSRAGANADIAAHTEQFKPAVSFGMTQNKTQSNETRHQITAIGSTLNAGGKVRLQAARDTDIIGSQVFGNNGLNIISGKDTHIVSAAGEVHHAYHSTGKTIGLMNGGSDFSTFIGHKTDTVRQGDAKVIHSGSIVGSGNGDTLILSGASYTQTGSQVRAEGDIDITAAQVRIQASENPYHQDYLHSFIQKGLTVGVSSPVIQAVEAVQAAAASGERIGQSKHTRTDLMAAANTGWQAYQAAQTVGSLSAQSTGNPTSGKAGAGISLTLTYGEQRNREHTRIQGRQGHRSSVLGDGTVRINAAGKGQASDIQVTGSDIAGKQGTQLNAEGGTVLETAIQSHSEGSRNSRHGWNAGVALDFSNGVSVGITAGGNLGKGYGNGDEQTHLHSHIGSKDSRTVIESGGDTVIKGGQIQGKGVTVTAENLHIESVQDTARFKGKQQNISGQITVGYGASGSASYSQSKMNADHATVTEQSGIFAGEDGYQINVKDRTDLKGGLITSSQSAEDAGKNRFATGTLTHSNIDNYSQYEGESFGLGVEGRLSGKTLGQGENNHSRQSRLSTVSDKNGLSGSTGYGKEADSQSSVTKSGINTQNIRITDEAQQIRLTGKTAQETQAQIQTDLSTDTLQANPSLSGSLNNRFDREALQSELDLQRTVSQEFGQTTRQAWAQINRKAKAHHDTAEQWEQAEAQALAKGDTESARAFKEQALVERKKAAYWQYGGVLLNMIGAGLSAPTQSTAGLAAATASPALSYAIGQEFKEAAQENFRTGRSDKAELTAAQEVAHVLAHAVLGAAVAAAGDNSALSGAMSSGGAEAAAPLISHYLYGEKDGGKLTAEQKETVAAITGLLGVASGAAVGSNATDAVQGGLNAHSAVENNFTPSLQSYKQKKYEKEFARRDPKGYEQYQREQLAIFDAIAQFAITPYGVYHDYRDAETLAEKALALSTVIPIGKLGSKGKELLEVASKYYKEGRFTEASNSIKQVLNNLQSSPAQMATHNGVNVPNNAMASKIHEHNQVATIPSNNTKDSVEAIASSTVEILKNRALSIDPNKYKYLFGEVVGNAHNMERSNQLSLSMKRLGVYNDTTGREILENHFKKVIKENNVVNTYKNNFGTFEVRESLFIGPSGKASLFQTTFKVEQDGTRVFNTLIPKNSSSK